MVAWCIENTIVAAAFQFVYGSAPSEPAPPSRLMPHHVIISQVIDADAVRTGANRSAMYFGVQGLLTKWVYAAALALMSFLFAKYGNSRETPFGVLLVAPSAALFCLTSALLYARYPERRILAVAVR